MLRGHLRSHLRGHMLDNNPSVTRKDEIKIIKILDVEKPPMSLEEMAVEKGFGGIEGYLRKVSREQYIEDLQTIRDNWLKAHPKFVAFADLISIDILRALERSKSDPPSVVATLKQTTEELEKFHQNHPGSMDIYGKSDLLLGLYYYFYDRGVNVNSSPDRKHIIFTRMDRY